MSTFKFKIENLIIKEDLGNGLKALIAPIHVHTIASENLGPVDFRHSRLGKVELFGEYKDAFQFPAGAKVSDNEILVIGFEYRSEYFLTIWVHAGDKSIMIAAFWRSGKYMKLSPKYADLDFVRKLTAAEIREIFEYIIEHPEILQTKI
jgi:hypothetical protein